MKEFTFHTELWLPRPRDVERIFAYRRQRLRELFDVSADKTHVTRSIRVAGQKPVFAAPTSAPDP